jgi:hypothetical protein
LERNPSACHRPGGSDLSLRLRAPTMTPALAPFNSKRKYQVHPRTERRRDPSGGRAMPK